MKKNENFFNRMNSDNKFAIRVYVALFFVMIVTEVILFGFDKNIIIFNTPVLIILSVLTIIELKKT